MRRDFFYCRASLGGTDFASFLKDIGANPSTVAEYLNLEQFPEKNEMAFMPWSDFCDFYEACANNLEEPYFGLKLALAMPKDLRHAGPFSYLISIASDVRNFIELGIEYQHANINALNYSYEENKPENELKGYIDFHPLADYSRQVAEYALAASTILGSTFLPNFRLKQATFQHKAPQDVTLYEEIFACPITFNAPRTSITVDLKYLSVKRQNFAHKALKPLVKSFLFARLSKNKRQKFTVSMTIAELLPALMGARRTNITSISHAMNINTKKLQRLLKDEGTTYSEILDNVRKNRARRLLLSTDIPVSDIAQLLDYATDKPFIAAFKRWYDETPARYRRTQKTSNN